MQILAEKCSQVLFLDQNIASFLFSILILDNDDDDDDDDDYYDCNSFIL